MITVLYNDLPGFGWVENPLKGLSPETGWEGGNEHHWGSGLRWWQWAWSERALEGGVRGSGTQWLSWPGPGSLC